MSEFQFHHIRRLEDPASRPSWFWDNGESCMNTDPAAGYADVERAARWLSPWLGGLDANDAAYLRDPAGKPTWHTGQPGEDSSAGDGGDGANADDYRALVDMEAD